MNPSISLGAVLLTVAVVGGMLYATVNLVPGLDEKVVPRRVRSRRTR